MVHDQLLINYLMATYPFGTYRLNPRLGRPAPYLVERVGVPTRRAVAGMVLARADAIAILPHEVHIIEALVRPEWYKIEQLDQYEQLFYETEEYREHWDKPVRKKIVTTIVNPYFEARAAARGVEVVHYRPYQVEYYLGSLDKRKQIPALSGVVVPGSPERESQGG